jgi:hypothetical protein
VRLSLGSAIALLALVLAAGLAWFPRGKGGIADAAREEKTLQSEEGSRAGPEGAGLA